MFTLEYCFCSWISSLSLQFSPNLLGSFLSLPLRAFSAHPLAPATNFPLILLLDSSFSFFPSLFFFFIYFSFLSNFHCPFSFFFSLLSAVTILFFFFPFFFSFFFFHFF
ncbi:hypothetical protein L6164_037402 [Bauhinia variegata]|uniref:Uncharacterized protein n=1 Tax=Bauhinia variegata TaxID=167791 RepID=A0ACB9KK94_BAUVA|nr:hypothetical protein L6164_037402 [Bauhinia variegata]